MYIGIYSHVTFQYMPCNLVLAWCGSNFNQVLIKRDHIVFPRTHLTLIPFLSMELSVATMIPCHILESSVANCESNSEMCVMCPSGLPGKQCAWKTTTHSKWRAMHPKPRAKHSILKVQGIIGQLCATTHTTMRLSICCCHNIMHDKNEMMVF